MSASSVIFKIIIHGHFYSGPLMNDQRHHMYLGPLVGHPCSRCWRDLNKNSLLVGAHRAHKSVSAIHSKSGQKTHTAGILEMLFYYYRES